VVFAVVGGLFATGIALDVFDHGEEFLSRQPLLDEAFGAMILLLAGFSVLVLRRWRSATREARLRDEAEERYRTLVEQVPTVSYTWDASRPAGEVPVPFISPQIEDLLGYPVQDWLSEPGMWSRVIHPHDRQRVLADSDAADREGRRFSMEYRAVHRDGHVVWIHDESNIVAWDADGNPLVAQGVMQDVTERKETEARLREAEDKFRFLIERIPAITYIEDAATGEQLYISPQIDEMLGYSPEEWIADPGLWAACMHPDDRERVLAANAADTGDVWSIDYRLYARDGRLHWVHNETVLLRDASGEPRVWQGVVTDITERKLAEERLIRAEERYRLLLEHLPVAVYTDAADDEVTALYVSPQYERITGYSPAQRLRDPGLWRRLLHPEDRDRTLAESDRTNRSGEDFDLEYRIVTRDGRTVWVHDHASLVPGADGAPVWQGVLTDVTAKRLAEETVSRRDGILAATAFAAERLLRSPAWDEIVDEVLERIGTAARATRAYVCRNDEAGDEVYSTQAHAWSRQGFEIVGHPELTERWPWRTGGLGRWVELLSSGRAVASTTDALPEDERAVLQAPELGVRSVLTVPIHVHGRWWGSMGLDQCEEDRAWSDAEVEAVAAAANMLGAAIEREEAAHRLADAEERYRAIVEHVPAAIYVDRADDSMETIYISPMILEITGITPEEWVESPDAWIRAVDPVDVDQVRRSYLEAVRREESWSGEYRMRTRDGRTIWVHDETTIVRDGDGGTMVQGVIHDVTERKLAEHALRESEQRERQAVERLRALDEMKNTFLAAVSHELRSPLTSILGLSLTLERMSTIADEERTDLLGRLGTNARKLDRLLKDLLDLDRLARGIVEPQHRRIDVAELAAGTLASLEGLMDREVILAVEPVVVQVDGPKVERIVENLLVNAARHTTDDRRIWLRVEPADGGVVIAVEDDGPGVPEEIRDAIFEPFRQGPTAAAHAPGTGIGLSLVSRFAELHGGRAWVQERDGGGASFRVFLPSTPRVAIAHDDGVPASDAARPEAAAEPI
jgi:PAS domain S-box-containing protein